MMRTRKAFLLFISATLCCNYSHAQQVTIKGKALSYEGKEISACTFADHITFTEKKLATAVVDQEGDFFMTVSIPVISPVFLKIGKAKGNMFIEPGTEYFITFPPDTAPVVNASLERSVELAFYLKDSLDINALVIDYNDRFDRFWSRNYQYFVQKRSRLKLDSFKLESKALYSKIKKDFFHTYVEYNVATLESNTSDRGRNNIFKEYLASRPIRYGNPEYMNFFNEFFKGHLQGFTLREEGTTVPVLLNERASYAELMKVLSLDNYLKNDTLRELVLLKGLWEFYYSGGYSKQSIVKVLDHIQQQSNIAEHRNIAGNMLSLFPQLVVGNRAPDFTLKDIKGKEQSLSGFKGKHVYLNFWSTECVTCLQEMKLIQDLKKKYGDKIVFVSISIDKNTDEMKKFQAKNPKYDWTLLLGDKAVPEKYEIRTTPAYFLIDDKGLFVKVPAEGPQNISETLFRIAKPKEKKINVGDKNNR